MMLAKESPPHIPKKAVDVGTAAFATACGATGVPKWLFGAMAKGVMASQFAPGEELDRSALVVLDEKSLGGLLSDRFSRAIRFSADGSLIGHKLDAAYLDSAELIFDHAQRAGVEIGVEMLNA